MERNRNRGSGAKWRMHSMVERIVVEKPIIHDMIAEAILEQLVESMP